MNKLPPNMEGEERNLKVLNEISKRLNARIAMPVSPQKCWNQIDNCWKPVEKSRISTEEMFRVAMNMSESCVGSNFSEMQLIGFSNGAYLVNYAVLYCLRLPFKAMLTVGGGGIVQDRDFLGCPKVDQIIGLGDPLLANALEISDRVRLRGGKIETSIFNGGHVFPLEPTLTILRNNISPGQR